VAPRPVAPRLVVVVLAVALSTLACGEPGALPGQPSSEPAPSTEDDGVAAARAADVEAVRAALASHPDPPDVGDELDRLAERGGELTDEAFLVELMRLVATRDGDGHTGIFPLGQPDLELWPVRLYRFEEGWRVIAARPPFQDLVGRAATGIGGRAVDEVAALVLPAVPHDTEASALGRVPQHLITPAVLRGVDVEPTLELDGEVVDVTPVPSAEYAEWAGLPYPLICPPLVDPSVPPWAVEERDGAVVLRYRRVLASSEGQGVRALADELAEAVARIDADVVVADLRDNPGGDTGTARPLVDALVDLEAERPGRLRLLVNRCTFSAATNVVVQLLEATDAVVVGEQMGGSPTMWGDAREHRLPSGIVLHVATRTWALGGADAPAALDPDVAVPVRWADHQAGVDAALDAALDAVPTLE
jgi:hypothetical protein